MRSPSRLEARVTRLEAESDVRRVMAEYVRLCDDLGPSTPMDRLGALFTVDAEWIGAGPLYAGAFGGHRGREAIAAFLGGYRSPPHFAMNAHFLTSEAIEADGARAAGRWTMLQASTYVDGTSDLRAARLRVRFVVEDESWRIAKFETLNVFSRSVEGWGAALPMTADALDTGDWHA